MDYTLASTIVSVIVSIITSTLIITWKLGQYTNKIDTLENKVRETTNDLKDMSEKLFTLQGGIDRDRVHQSEYVQSKSPLSLTEKGKSLLLDSKGKDIIDEHMDELVKDIGKLKPKTAYDIQEFAKVILNQKRNTDWFIPLKRFLYKKGLELNIIIDVLGIYLRDQILEQKKLDVDQPTSEDKDKV